MTNGTFRRTLFLGTCGAGLAAAVTLGTAGVAGAATPVAVSTQSGTPTSINETVTNTSDDSLHLVAASAGGGTWGDAPTDIAPHSQIHVSDYADQDLQVVLTYAMPDGAQITLTAAQAPSGNTAQYESTSSRWMATGNLSGGLNSFGGFDVEQR